MSEKTLGQAMAEYMEHMKDVGKFLKSDALLRLPNGSERAEPTVRKTVRVMRMFLCWALEQGYIAKLPLPKDVPLGRNTGG